MKTFLITLLIAGFCLTASADVYCLFDKNTGEGKGTVSIKEDYVSDWAKNFILKKAPDNSYKGKKGHEIKLEGGKLRLATEQEISDFLAAQEQEQQNVINAKEKQKFLDWLDDEDIKTKIKDIKNP